MTTTKEAGKRGGKSTLLKHGKEHFSKIAKELWANRNKRLKILSKFTIGELENPITLKTIQDKLEQVDKSENE